MSPYRFSARAIVFPQLALAAGALALLGLCPPRQGAMILLPLVPGTGNAALVRATLADARLVGSGPLPQSFVIWGERARIVPQMLTHGVLVLSAPAAGCSKVPEVTA